MSSKRLPWFPLYYDDFRASPRVCRMTLTERGAYLFLLMACWEGAGRVKNDREALAEAMNIDPEEVEEALSPRVLRCFEEVDGWLVNRRMEAEVLKQQKIREQQSEKGRASALSRFEKSGSAQPAQAQKTSAHPNSGSSRPEQRFEGIRTETAAVDRRFASPGTAVRTPTPSGSVPPEQRIDPAKPRIDQPKSPVRRKPNSGSKQPEQRFGVPELSTTKLEEEASSSLSLEDSRGARAKQQSKTPDPEPGLDQAEPVAEEASDPDSQFEPADQRAAWHGTALASPQAIAERDFDPEVDPAAESLQRAPRAVSGQAPKLPPEGPEFELEAARRTLEKLGVDCRERWNILPRLVQISADHGKTLGEVVAAVIGWVRAEQAKRSVANPGALVYDALQGGYLAGRLGFEAAAAKAQASKGQAIRWSPALADRALEYVAAGDRPGMRLEAECRLLELAATVGDALQAAAGMALAIAPDAIERVQDRDLRLKMGTLRDWAPTYSEGLARDWSSLLVTPKPGDHAAMDAAKARVRAHRQANQQEDARAPKLQPVGDGGSTLGRRRGTKLGKLLELESKELREGVA